MTKLIRRIAAVTVPVTLIGIAIVGTAATASAAPLSSDHERRVVTTTPGHHDDGPAGAHNNRGRTDSWYRAKDGYWYHDSDDNRRHYRYDGHHYFRWVNGKWDTIVLASHRNKIDAWYLNQIHDIGTYDHLKA
ncbi:hypothetical protein [Streptomyces sp. NPDC059489]|uniref:hypothetical protein n=1 Tax=Streptomyces sp. NPDC059489 TaxID=3346849 RepID=UPI0036B74038